MIKKTLISFICILILLIALMAGFRYYLDICGNFLIPESSTIDSKNQSIDYVFDYQKKDASSKDKYGVFIGEYKDKNCYFFSVFDDEGKKVSEGGFGASLETCIIHDIRIGDDGIFILCEENGYASLYFIDMKNEKEIAMTEKLNFTMMKEEEKAIKLLLPDDECQYVLAAWTTGAELYLHNGTPVKQYEYTEKSVISCGLFKDDYLVLCGAESSFADINYFDVAFVEVFNARGESVFYKNLYKKSSCISAAMECQITPEGNLKIYGRYFDYRYSPVILNSLETGQYNEYKLYGHGANYFIYDNVSKVSFDVMESSIFISEFDKDGNEKDVILFSAINDFRVPSISQEMSLDKLDENGNFELTLARISPERDSYFLSINGTAIEIPSNIILYYDTDEAGGLFVSLRESGSDKYSVFYYNSLDEFNSEMKVLLEAMSYANLFDTLLPVIAMSTLCLVGFILLYAKHKWRE